MSYRLGHIEQRTQFQCGGQLGIEHRRSIIDLDPAIALFELGDLETGLLEAFFFAINTRSTFHSFL